MEGGRGGAGRRGGSATWSGDEVAVVCVQRQGRTNWRSDVALAVGQPQILVLHFPRVSLHVWVWSSDAHWIIRRRDGDGGGEAVLRSREGRPVVNVVCWVESTQEADGGDPAVHVLLRLSHEVPDPLLCAQVEHKITLQLLLRERQTSVHLLTEVEVDGSDRASGLWVLVVLQHVGFAAETTAAQHEPTPLPRISSQLLLRRGLSEPAFTDDLPGSAHLQRNVQRDPKIWQLI